MSSSGAWGPAPPGVDLTEHQNRDLIGSVVAVMVLGLFAVALRLFVRLTHRGPGLAEDDYFIVFAATCGIGTAVCCLITIPWGGGKHLWVVTFDEFTKLYQTTYAFVIVYITCISATKVSIMLFYRRMFGKGIIWNIVFGLAVCHWLEVTITWLSGCRPVNYYWKQYTDPTAVGTCIDASLFYFINGIIGLFIDVSILLVPVPTILKLKMPPTKKLFVGGILLLGGFVCIASAVRIVMMDQLVKSADFTWAMSKVFICGGSVATSAVSHGHGSSSGGSGVPHKGHGYFREEGFGFAAPGLGHGHGHHGHGGNVKKVGPMVHVAGVDGNGRSGRREWGLHGLGSAETTLRGEDEIELTVDISGREVSTSGSGEKGSAEERAAYRNEIMVRKDFSWVSTGSV
ncbi:hypothetical protein CHGG_02225 [Chaetomium globosum CBS 148.51]|uniref:Rhodopsin domain-containing protein n=1 Tax=Chaetomium globosum (strain ATCC 6205 / CBS 148.51 / DSM 1962 / NBRC 6347 / NRRL 1970) TaxID=306901 RepID=Q2HC29_CHAGB|nr:uncharacterized protein CHGG_02225 [Chaetomium globosum CBS 148.51]EAQ90290.1 hypothetical protein CHGG_02225 [Chaetomium globosum CBS 148.51]